jgi:salicylate hydroxylase
LDGETLETTICGDFTETGERYGSPWYFLHRADLHGELRRLAVQQDGLTDPVKINLGAEVVESDVDTGMLTLSDGTIICKDLIVAADGVHVSPMFSLALSGMLNPVAQSSLVSKVIGRENPAKFTGLSAFRFLIPTEKLMADPETRPFFENQPAALRISNLRDKRKFVVYPCRGFPLPSLESRKHCTDWSSGQMQNCLILYPCALGKSKREGREATL